MKRFILTTLICFSLSINANPSPFGLEINKASISDLKKKYKTEFIDRNIYSKGDMYEIDVRNIDIDGLIKATAVFNPDEKLVAMFARFSKHKFDYLYQTLNKKYKVLNKEIPFVGSKRVKFIDGNSSIFITSPHLDYEMSINYVDNNFLEVFNKKVSERQQKQRDVAESKL